MKSNPFPFSAITPLFLIGILIGTSIPASAYMTNISYQTLQGEINELNKFDGQILLVEGMTTWCEVCKKEMNELKEIYDIIKNDNIGMLSIALDLKSDSPEKLMAYKESFNARWEFGIDYTKSFQEYFSINSYPGIIILNTDGSLIKRWEGLFVQAYDILDVLDNYVALNYDVQRYSWNDFLVMFKGNVLIPIFALFVVILMSYWILKKIGKLMKREYSTTL